MSDRHLNIFYSYNLDEELIEDNLTRAFIVTLNILSPQVLAQFMHKMLDKKSNKLENIDFARVGFALQDNITLSNESLRMFTYNFILSITGDGIIHGLNGENDENIFDKIIASPYDSPDAWIYDNNPKSNQYCFLIESKKIDNFLFMEQVIRYSKKYYGMNSIQEFKDSLICITWYDVLEACEYFCETKDETIINPQELLILEHLKEFLSFYGVLPYIGWNMNEMPNLPTYNFLEIIDFHFEQIPYLPEYNFDSTTQFGLEQIPTLPSFNLKNTIY